MKYLLGFLFALVLATTAHAGQTGQPSVLGYNSACPSPGTGQCFTPYDSSGAGVPVVLSSGFAGCAGATIANTKTKPFSNAASASNLLLVSGVASQNVHICAINLGPAASTAVNVALVEGTTTTNPCDTNTAGMMGGATAATGWNLAANGGLTYGNGVGLLAVTAAAADSVCLLFSGAVQVSGVVTYTVF